MRISSNWQGRRRIVQITVALLLLSSFSFAHEINYAMERAPAEEVTWFYFLLGIEHIVPDGIDHILFVVGLCLLSPKFKTILWQATAFTVAHSVTLALSMKSIIAIPAAIVEPIIALSIVFVAIENLVFRQLHPWRIVIVFFFGLIHGTGFASALNEIGLPRNKFLNSILSFNAGVEVGQVLVILVVFAALVVPFGQKPWYRNIVVKPLSLLIAVVAFHWTVERVFFE